MSDNIDSIPPWHSGTELFEQPDARCELVLDGQNRSVSVALWEGYCYLKVDGLEGLWAITRPYDQTDLAQFVAKQIEAGEVGKVYEFSYTFSNLDPITNCYTVTHQKEPLMRLDLVAIIRSDNSALVRETYAPHFVETSPFMNGDRREKLKLPPTKANRPSLWSSKRKLVGRCQIGRMARGLVFRTIPEEELVKGKTGSMLELAVLLEALWLYGSILRDFSFYQSVPSLGIDYYPLHWPYGRSRLGIPHDLHYKLDVSGFFQILWDHYHFEKGCWIPAKHTRAATATNKRYDWEIAGHSPTLTLAINANPTAHERLEAALVLEDFFKDKVSDDELNQLLGENA
jgi:hypothetical protein